MGGRRLYKNIYVNEIMLLMTDAINSSNMDIVEQIKF